MENCDFRQKKTFFIAKKKILKFDPSNSFMDELVKLSCKLKKRHLYELRFLIYIFLHSHHG